MLGWGVHSVVKESTQEERTQPNHEEKKETNRAKGKRMRVRSYDKKTNKKGFTGMRMSCKHENDDDSEAKPHIKLGVKVRDLDRWCRTVEEPLLQRPQSAAVVVPIHIASA